MLNTIFFVNNMSSFMLHLCKVGKLTHDVQSSIIAKLTRKKTL